jgi:hypothetical protein
MFSASNRVAGKYGLWLVGLAFVLFCVSTLSGAKTFEARVKTLAAGDSLTAWWRARPLGKPDSIIVSVVSLRTVTVRRAYPPVLATDSVALKLTPPLAPTESLAVRFIVAAKVRGALTKPDTTTRWAFGAGAAFDSTALTYLDLSPDSVTAYAGDTVTLTRVRHDNRGNVLVDTLRWWVGLKPGTVFAVDSGPAAGGMGFYAHASSAIYVLHPGRNEPPGFTVFAEYSTMAQLPTKVRAPIPGEIGAWSDQQYLDPITHTPNLTLTPDSTVVAHRL